MNPNLSAALAIGGLLVLTFWLIKAGMKQGELPPPRPFKVLRITHRFEVKETEAIDANSLGDPEEAGVYVDLCYVKPTKKPAFHPILSWGFRNADGDTHPVRSLRVRMMMYAQIWTGANAEDTNLLCVEMLTSQSGRVVKMKWTRANEDSPWTIVSVTERDQRGSATEWDLRLVTMQTVLTTIGVLG